MPAEIFRFLPWTDRAGRFSWLRAVVFALLFAPALLLFVRWWSEDLGARPLTEAIHVAGDWAVRLLILAVAITPLRHLSGRAQLIGVRRMIGIAALTYTTLHVALWAADLGLDAVKMARELLVRPYLTLGFVAFAGLVALGTTSTDGMIRRLGGEAWKRLHDLVHPIAVLAIVHLFLQSKLDLTQGAILTGIAFGGLTVRLMIDRRMTLGWVAVAAATVAAFVFGVAGEAVWFVLKTGRAVGPLLAANFAFEARIAPAWVAAGITLVVAAVAVSARKRMPRRGAGGEATVPRGLPPSSDCATVSSPSPTPAPVARNHLTSPSSPGSTHGCPVQVQVECRNPLRRWPSETIFGDRDTARRPSFSPRGRRCPKGG